MSEAMNDAQPDEGGSDGKKRGGLLYKLALASVGSVMLAQEEISSFFRRDPNEPPRDPSEPAGKPLPLKASPDAEDRIDSTINRVLASLAVASRDQVSALNAEVDALEAKIEALRASRS
ncbi:MAG: hypothetical protein JKY65_30285 [Planctomycetes bacterium]|nr:hypothetical protein [Planctomycetota bacterium]